MNKRLTRVLSLIMVLAMFLSVSVPAFALEDGWDREIKVIGDSSVFADDTAGDDANAADEGEPDEGWDREISAGEIREFNADPDNDDPDPKMELFTENEELGYSVTVEAPMGALPTLAELRAEPVEIENIREAVEGVMEGEANILVALDISFWLDDVEIEPEEPVQVIIAAPELEGRNDLTLIHLPDEDEPETVALIGEEDLTFELGTNEIAFLSKDFSTYVVAGSSRTATVLYGFIENGAFVRFDSRDIASSSNSFPSSQLNASSYTNNPTYLIYDFPGYTYKETRLSDATTGTQIWPALNVYNSGGYYRPAYRFTYSNYSNSSFYARELTNNASIYVIYEPKVVTSGGSSQGDDPDDPPAVDPPDLPAAKSVEPNGDGTYDITLSVTGVVEQHENITKASVIVIFDTSGSMNWEMASSNTPSNSANSRMSIAKKAVKNLATELLGKTDSDGNKLVQMALVSFSTTAEVYNFGTETDVTPKYTSNASTFNAAVDTLSAGGITNWEQALDKANALEVPRDTPTYVIFVSDGDPTVHISRRNLTDRQVYDMQYGDYYDGDEDGLNGSSSYNTASTIRQGLFGFSAGVYDEEHYNAAVPAGQAILTAGKEFYTIGLSTSVTRMSDFTTAVGAASNHYFPATSQDELTEAFDSIADAVTSNLGFTNVSIDDGVTQMTTIESDALTGTPTNFVYRKGTNQTDPTQNPVWTGDDVPVAEITNDHHVIWDVASIGTLENGVTYSVTFTIWPSQESYNIIADINNGIIRDAEGNIVRTGTPDEAYAAQPESIRRQIVIKDGVYTLLTNTGANVHYMYNDVEGSGGVEVKKEGSMPLDTTYFSMTKDWVNVLPDDTRTAQVLARVDDEDGKTYLVNSNDEWILDDEGNRIERNWSTFNSWKDKAVYYVDLIVTKGDEDYTEARLTSDKNWTWDQMFVAPGVLTHDKTATSGAIEVRERGDDYTVREKPSESYYWELFAEIYHPMVINGTACVLQKVDENDTSIPEGLADAENTFNGDYYNIEGTVYKKLGSASDAVISAVNERRSYLNLTKTVTGENAPADAYFTYTIKMENPDGLYQGETGYTANNDDFWFSIYDDNDTIVKDSTLVTGAEAEAGNTGYWHFANVENGMEITVKLKAGWNLRVTNLLSGTTYEITENEAAMDDGFVFTSVEAKAKLNGEEQTYEPTVEGAKINGVIENANTDYTVTYTNDYLGVYYVYHSSDNTVERFPMAVDGVRAVDVDLVAMTKDNFLYGGYYHDYSGKKVDPKTLEYTNDKATDEGATPYTGEVMEAWKGGNPYSDSGFELDPEPNTVYYLKEVPEDTYLIPYLHYTYYTQTQKIGTAWLISDTDDYFYLETGFVITHQDGSKEYIASMVTKLTVTCSTGGKTEVLEPTKVFTSELHDGYTSPKSGYLIYHKIINGSTVNLQNGDKVQQYWVTPDGLLVTGKWSRTYQGLDGVYTGITKTDTPETSTVSVHDEANHA